MALRDICMPSQKPFCGYRIRPQHGSVEIADRRAGRNAGKPELSACTVVVNVSGLAGTRNEIHGSASLAQNAHTDWHNQIIASEFPCRLQG
jgi:hypothetical protein